MPWHSPRRYSPWSLLHSQFLIIPVHSLLLINPKRSFRLTNNTVTKIGLVVIILVDGSLLLTTSITDKVNSLQLGKDLASSGDNASDFDHCVEIHLS